MVREQGWPTTFVFAGDASRHPAQLDLSFNEIDDACAVELAKALSAHRTLTRVCFSRSPYGRRTRCQRNAVAADGGHVETCNSQEP